MAFESFKGFSENQVKQPRGTDVGFTDYLIDAPVGAIKGLSQAVQGLLSLGAMPIDYLANTDLLNGINNIFDKITPDTKTAVGDISSVITQFGVPFGAAVKIAGGITKLKGISTMTQLGSLPTRAAKGTELVKRAGYYGSLGGLTDFAVSTPDKLGTLSDLTGLTQQTDLRGLSGRDRAVETLKGKLKFGAEGALIGAAVPLLPTAASLGFRYGIIPGAKVVGTVGGKALEYVVDKPLTFAMNRIVGSKEKSILQQSLIRSGSILKKGAEKIGLAGDWRHRPVEGGFISHVKRQLVRLADQFKSAKGLTGEIKSVQDSANFKVEAGKKTLQSITGGIEDAQRNMIKDFKVKFDNGDSILKLQVENNKVKDYILASGQTADDILATIPKDIHKDVKAFKDIINKSTQKFKIFGGDVDLKQMAMLDYDSYAKQRFGAFNNEKFKFNPLLENKAFDFFKKQIQKDPIQMANINKRATQTKKSVDVLLNQETKDKLLNFKQDVISANKKPDQVFQNIAEASRINPKDVLKGSDQVPDVIKKLLSVEEGRTAGELAFKGAKDASGKAITKDVETFNALNAGLDVVLSQSKQIYGKLAFDDFIRTGLNTPANPRGLIHTTESMSRLRLRNELPKLSQIAKREKLPDTVQQSELFQGNYFAAPEIANALVGAKEITSGLYTIPFYKSFMALKAGAQISKTILSPMTQVRNFTTASMFPLANGLIGGRIGFKDAWGLTIGDIFQGAKTTPEKIAKIERLIERGVIDQNINVQEMRRVLEATKDGKISFNKMMNTPIMRKLTDIYQGADNFWKIYTDNFYQGSLKTAFGDPSAVITGAKVGTQAAKNADTFFRNYDDWFQTVAGRKLDRVNPLTGLPKTPLEVAEEASAYLVTNTVPTYSKVPKIVENIRNLPLGNFVAFPAEILRTTSNIISIGAKELTSKNPFIRQMGARRLVGVSTVLGGIGYTTKKGAQYLTGVDDETMDSFQRSFAPPYQRNSTLIPMTSPDENGKFKYYNFSYSNPYDTLVAPANAVLAAFSEGRLNKDNVNDIVMNALFGGAVDPNQRKGAITEFLQPFITESIGTERAFDVTVRGGRDSRGKVIYYKDIDSADTIIAKSLNHILGGLSPGALTSSTRIWDGATGRFSDYGTQKDMSDEVVALLSGVRVEEAKPLSSVPFILTSYNKDKSSIRSKFSRKAYSARNTPEEKLGAFSQFIKESYDSQNKMFQVIQDAQNLGIDESELKEKFGKRLTKIEINSLFNGEFKPPSYSKDAFKSTVERLEAENPIDAAKIEEQNDVVMDIFNSVQRDLKGFDLGQSLNDLQLEIDESLSPGVEETRDLRSNLVSPTTGIEQVAELQPPPQIGTPVNQQVAAAGNTVGNQYNLFVNNPNAKILFPRDFG
jgi:hypothetical protein